MKRQALHSKAEKQIKKLQNKKANLSYIVKNSNFGIQIKLTNSMVVFVSKVMMPIEKVIISELQQQINLITIQGMANFINKEINK